SAADAPVTVAVPQRTLYFDAYSGSLLGEGAQGIRRFMSETRAWHRWLAIEGEGRPVARNITGWSNFLFLFIVVSGEGAQGIRRFMSETRAWHRWLAIEGEGRPVARNITGWSNFLFLFIVVS